MITKKTITTPTATPKTTFKEIESDVGAEEDCVGCAVAVGACVDRVVFVGSGLGVMVGKAVRLCWEPLEVRGIWVEGVSVGEGVGEGVTVLVGVGCGVRVEGEGDGEGEGEGEGEGVGVGEGVVVRVEVGARVGVGVGVAVGT